MLWLDNMFERTPEEVGFFLEDLVTTWLAFYFSVFEAIDYRLKGDYLVDAVLPFE